MTTSKASAIDTGILLETGTNELEILEFYITEFDEKTKKPSNNYFGVNVAKVMQVIETPDLIPPESAPHPSFMGTIPLRQHILPVLDLSVWLEIDMPKSNRDIVIVTEFSNSITGFLVSGVTEIHRVGWPEVIPPAGFIAHTTDAIVGMVDKKDHFIQLLDLESILSRMQKQPENTASIVAEEEYIALVADDSATIRFMLQTSLEQANFKHRITKNGDEALKLMMQLKQQAQEENRDITDFVNVVISDIEMPLMDGFSLTKSIKDDPVLGKLPVILYSSIITEELRHKGDAVRADFQVSKPDLQVIAGKAIELIENRTNE